MGASSTALPAIPAAFLPVFTARFPALFPKVFQTFSLAIFLATCLTASFIQPARGQSTPVAGYSPGARSATTANTMLDSVVGNSHSPIKTQTSITGDLYHIASDGTVTAPNGLLVSPGGCQTPGISPALPQKPAGGQTLPARSHYRFGTGRHGRGFETVMIGVSAQPSLTTTGLNARKTRRATLNASYGPNGLYILPEPCMRSHPSDRALTLDAATSLASADGNAFTLAGNRSTEIPVNEARALPGGDVELRNNALSDTTTPPSPPAQISPGSSTDSSSAANTSLGKAAPHPASPPRNPGRIQP